MMYDNKHHAVMDKTDFHIVTLNSLANLDQEIATLRTQLTNVQTLLESIKKHLNMVSGK